MPGGASRPTGAFENNKGRGVRVYRVTCVTRPGTLSFERLVDIINIRGII